MFRVIFQTERYAYHMQREGLGRFHATPGYTSDKRFGLMGSCGRLHFGSVLLRALEVHGVRAVPNLPTEICPYYSFSHLPASAVVLQGSLG